jgi:N-ethylmaleimide reductase
VAAQVEIYTSEGMQAAPRPHALTVDEIRGVVAQYALAAANAIDAGFDGVEIHAGNGYLIDQFLQASANRREDSYGGSVANRCRLLREVSEAVATRVGADRTGVRLSPFGTFNDVNDPDPAALFGTAISMLDTLDLAYLHVINLEVSGDRTTAAAAVDVAAFSRQHYKGTLMVAGGYTRATADAALQSGAVDLIGFGRPYISNPDLARRLRDGLPLAQPHRPTFYTSGAAGYTDYPPAP